MSYLFNQFRRSQINSYMKKLTYSLENLKTISPLSQEVIFLDKKIDLTLLDDNILKPANNLGKMKSYYLRVKIYKKDTKQSFSVKLVNTTKTKDNEQELEPIILDSGIDSDYSIYEYVIAPNAAYNEIHFVLNRIKEDYNMIDIDNYYGRKIRIEVERLTEIFNVLDNIPSVNKLKQLGIQSHPGLLMSIQGEAIRVGRSGIYEINNGVSVDYIGFVVEEDDNNYFIMDYQY